MLVDHLIKLDVIPELRLPPPRSVRRRSGRGLAFGLAHFILLPFILLGLILLLALINALVAAIVIPKPPQSGVWTLALFSLGWNCVTVIFIWRIYVRPFVHRWLVIYGHATVGPITGFTSGGGGRGGGELHVHYEFSPIGKAPMKCRSSVDSMRAWQELKEGNTVIDIVYNPKNPKWNVPYICVDYEVVSDAQQVVGPERG